MADRRRGIAELDPGWQTLIINDPAKLYHRGNYRGVFLEIGPGKTPVSLPIAQDNPNIFILNVEANLWPSQVHDIAINTELPYPPPNWRFYNAPIEDLKLNPDIPILGFCSFFPPRNGNILGKELAELASEHQCPALIITESNFNGNWGGLFNKL